MLAPRSLSRWFAVVSALAGLPAAACNQPTPSTNQPAPTTNHSPKPMPDSSSIHNWMTLRDLSPPALRAKLGITDADVSAGGAYYGLRPVDKWHRPAVHPAYFIIQGDQLAMIYIDDQRALSGVHPDALRAEFGEPEASLRSRAGKAVPLKVHASKGLAYAGKEDRVYYLEIFPPMSLADYQARIYEDPGVYRK